MSFPGRLEGRRPKNRDLKRGPGETEYADQTDEHFREKKGDRLVRLLLPWVPSVSHLRPSLYRHAPLLSFFPPPLKEGVSILFFFFFFIPWAATDRHYCRKDQGCATLFLHTKQ